MNDFFCSLALQYNFSSLKAYALDGGDLNILGSDGRSLLTCFVEGYLNYGEAFSRDENELFQEHMDDDSFWNSFLPEVVKIPLEERPGNIKEELDFLLDHGCDPNLCSMCEGETESALMLAVLDLDYYLAEYLLQRGADPSLWLLEKNREIYDKDYFILDELEGLFREGCHGDRGQAVLSMAELLHSYGLTGWQGVFIEF